MEHYDFKQNAAAPVALFVFNELRRTQITISALQKNIGASATDLFVFSDGGKDDLSWRQVNQLRSWLDTIGGFRSVNIIKRSANGRLEYNLVDGITEIVDKFGRVIVLEDDVVTHSDFLSYMNSALTHYFEKETVMHISAFNFIQPSDPCKTILWRYPESYGWATWKNRWAYFVHYRTEQDFLSSVDFKERRYLELNGDFDCLSTIKHTPIPWDICWYAAMAKRKGLAVAPPHSLITNIGLYGGTHFSRKGWKNLFCSWVLKHRYYTQRKGIGSIQFSDVLIENKEELAKLAKFYRESPRKFTILGWLLLVPLWLLLARTILGRIRPQIRSV